MNLSIKERILLLIILQSIKEGNVTTLRIIRDLVRDLAFSEEEYAKFELVEKAGSYSWNLEGSKFIKTVEIGAKGKELISGELKKLSESNTLKPEQLDLYDKFIVN